MPASLQSNLDELKAAIREGKVVPFVGAGVSRNLTRVVDSKPVEIFSTWREFLEAAISEIEKGGVQAQVARALLMEGRYEEAASEARKKCEPEDWHTLLRKTFNQPAEPRPDGLELPEALWKLGSNLVITTNYDDVLEWARPGAKTWNVQSAFAQGDYLATNELSNPTVWHLHGHVDEPSSIILTSEDYARLYHGPGQGRATPYEAAREALRNIITGKTLLFVGFSGDDGAVGRELARIRTLFEGGTRKHFMLVRKHDVGPVIEKVRGLGIRLVEFPGFGPPLVDFVQSLAAVRESPGARGAAREPPPRPRSNRIDAPNDAPCLLRQEQLQAVWTAVADPKCRGAILWGSHGTGKSLVAGHLARVALGELPDEEETLFAGAFDAVVWVTMEGNSSDHGILRVYREIAETLGRSDLGNTARDEQLAAGLRELLGRDGNRTLLVIDALEDVLQEPEDAESRAGIFRHFLETLPTSSFTLITAPVRPGAWKGFNRIQFSKWTRDQSLTYLREMRREYSLPESPDEDEALRQAAGGVPRALRAGFQLLAGNIPVVDVVARLKGPAGEMSRLRDLQMRHLDRLGLIVAAATDLFTGSADLEWVRNATGLDRESFGLGLRKAELKEETRGGRKYLVVERERRGEVAEYLKSLGDPLEPHAREMAVHGTFRFFRSHADWESQEEQRQALSEQLDNLRHLLKCALDLRQTSPEAVEMQDVFELASGVAYLLHVEGAWQEAEVLLREMLNRLKASSRPSDRPLRVKIRVLLGRHYAHVADARRAIEVLNDALECARKLDDRTLEAEVLMRQGHALHRQRPRRAMQLLTRAMRLCDGHLERNDVRIAAAGYMAAIQNGSGDFDAALATLDEIRRACGAVIAPRIAAHHDRLRGDACVGKNDLDRARDFYHRSEEVAKAWSDRRLHAWNLLGLARCERDPGRAREARDIFQKLNMEFEVRWAGQILEMLTRPSD